MPMYYGLNYPKEPFTREKAQRTASGLLKLKSGFEEKKVPQRRRSSRLLLATWNIREFESGKYGPRGKESLYYIAEIIDHFDIVAVQEVRDDLSSLEQVMDILGFSYKYLITDVTEGRQGNVERMAFIYDTRKVSFGGLAGEVVIPPIDKDHPAPQYARTPFMVGFRTGWFKFTICTTHMYYGKSVADDPQRISEIRQLSTYLAEHVKKKNAWSHNMILLGDFNIFATEDDPAFTALTEPGFHIHPNLVGQGSNVKKDKHFDQIAFIAPDLKDNLEQCDAGVFDFYEYVYTPDEEHVYQSEIPESDTGEPGRYNDWRTFQMSDHLPMWIELRVDFSPEYLEKVARGDHAEIPVSPPVDPQ